MHWVSKEERRKRDSGDRSRETKAKGCQGSGCLEGGMMVGGRYDGSESGKDDGEKPKVQSLRGLKRGLI
jgi:hypothetical protein